MRHLKIMLAWLCALLMTASCSNEMEPENTTGSDVAQLIKIGNFPAFDEGTQTRALGAADPGKTAWAEGDEVLLKIQFKKETAEVGTPQCFTLTYSESTSGWAADKPLNLSNYLATTADITAYYAPAYEWDAASLGNLKLKSEKTAGTDEYLVYTAKETSLEGGISIDFSGARTYSRLRVVAGATNKVTLTLTDFTTNGETATTATAISATADDKGNAYFYGSWTADATMGISVNGVTVNKKITAQSVANRSYAWMPCMQFTVKVAAGDKFSIPFPTNGSQTTAVITVNWGDGNSETINAKTSLTENDDFNHTYNQADTYQITLAFAEDNADQKMPRFDFYTNRSGDGSNATKLISMDTPLLKSANQSFTSCFAGCSNLAQIPAGLFANNTEVEGFIYCFRDCSKLTQIPAGLFDNNIVATDFSYCFNGCSKLTQIPAGLFDNNTAATNFSACFSGCSIAQIPAGLFDKNIAAKNFVSCFSGCSNLAQIPTGLFDKNIAATDFSLCFQYCKNLTEIPANLFDNNTKATNFSFCFDGCSIISQIPAGLFANNTAATNFSACFNECKKLKLNEYIFINETHTSKTRFADTTSEVNFYGCFADCGTGLGEGEDGGTAPDLWDTNVYTFKSVPTSTACFYGCDKVKNFSNIPEGWVKL